MEAYIVLGILGFMILGFLIGKIPYGVTTMICCCLLVLSGVGTIQQAFSGFCNTNLILIAGAVALCDALGKTSFIPKIQERMMHISGKKSSVVVVLICIAATIFFACFMPIPGTMVVMMMVLGAIGTVGDVTQSRMLLPIACMASMWASKIPVAMGATSYTRYNAFTEAYGYTFEMLDVVKCAGIPAILCSLFVLFGYKLLPKNEIDIEKLKGGKRNDPLPKKKEIAIYVVFVLVMAAMFLNKVLGNIMYVLPAVGLLVLILLGAVSVEDARKSVSGDMIFMLAGIFALSDMISTSGAGEIIGNVILKVLGGNPSGEMIVIVFALASFILTNLMSNLATFNCLIPLAVAAAVTAGYDPRAAAMATGLASYIAIVLPSGMPATAMAFAAGRYTLKSTLKFTIPFSIIALVSTIACTLFMFPC